MVRIRLKKELLKKLREEKGMTQKELAENLGLKQSYISRWELGINNPDEENAEKLMNIFGYGIIEYIDVDDTRELNMIIELSTEKYREEERKALEEKTSDDILSYLEREYKKIELVAKIWRWCY